MDKVFSIFQSLEGSFGRMSPERDKQTIGSGRMEILVSNIGYPYRIPASNNVKGGLNSPLLLSTRQAGVSARSSGYCGPSTAHTTSTTFMWTRRASGYTTR